MLTVRPFDLGVFLSLIFDFHWCVRSVGADC